MARVLGSALLGGLSGKTGNVVFVRGENGEIMVRQRVVPRDPWTPAQATARALMTHAGHFYTSLTDEEVEAWADFAEALRIEARLNGERTTIRPYNAYMSLATRYLALHPEDEPPRLPPPSPFLGDTIRVQAGSEPGTVRFEASGPNASDVTTELLLQQLRYAHGGPQRDKYRRQAFVRFESGSLDASIDVSPGRYAPALRFVRISTGQASPLLPLPTVRVL